MTVKGWVCAISVFFVCAVLPFAFYILRGKKELSVDKKPVSTVQDQSPVLEQTDFGAVRLMENVTYVSSPGHSVFSVLAFLVLVAMCAFLVYYVYIKFVRWKRAQARAVVALQQQEVVAGPQQVVVIPPAPAVHQGPDLPPSYSAAELQEDRARFVANLRRAGYSGPSRHRRRRRDPEMEMVDRVCPHHFHDEDDEEVDMEEVDQAMNRRARHRVQSPRSSVYRSSVSPGSQGGPPMPRARLSDTEVMMVILVVGSLWFMA
jgi:hypothetical protein